MSSLRFLHLTIPKTLHFDIRDKPLWRPFSDKKTIYKYVTLLHQFARAIAITADHDHPSGYSFPLEPSDLVNLGILRKKLIANTPKDAMDELHNFIKPLLYPRESADSRSQWDCSVECFIALFALRTDGTFKEAKNATKPFPVFHYFIRCAIFFEAKRTVSVFDGDLLK